MYDAMIVFLAIACDILFQLCNKIKFEKIEKKAESWTLMNDNNTVHP